MLSWISKPFFSVSLLVFSLLLNESTSVAAENSWKTKLFCPFRNIQWFLRKKIINMGWSFNVLNHFFRSPSFFRLFKTERNHSVKTEISTTAKMFGKKTCFINPVREFWHGKLNVSARKLPIWSHRQRSVDGPFVIGYTLFFFPLSSSLLQCACSGIYTVIIMYIWQ